MQLGPAQFPSTRWTSESLILQRGLGPDGALPGGGGALPCCFCCWYWAFSANLRQTLFFSGGGALFTAADPGSVVWVASGATMGSVDGPPPLTRALIDTGTLARSPAPLMGESQFP